MGSVEKPKGLFGPFPQRLENGSLVLTVSHSSTSSTTTGFKTFRMEMYTGVRKTFQIGCLEDPQTLLLGEIVILRFSRFTERLHKTLLGLSMGIKLPYNREPVDRFCQVDKNTSTN